MGPLVGLLGVGKRLHRLQYSGRHSGPEPYNDKLFSNLGCGFEPTILPSDETSILIAV